MIAMTLGVGVIGLLMIKTYTNAPPVLKQMGQSVFSDADIRTGQQVSLEYGLMTTTRFGDTAVISDLISPHPTAMLGYSPPPASPSDGMAQSFRLRLRGSSAFKPIFEMPI